MKPVVAEVAFLGHVFLNADDVELGALATELDLRSWASAVAHDTAGLEIEYNRLFLNPLGSPCALWQSANADESRLLGAAHLSALEWFRRFGVEPAAANEPADHIGLLLLFYAHLVEVGAEAEVVNQFGSEHLVWIPEFCEKVRRTTTVAFYRSVCTRLEELVRTAIGAAASVAG